MAVSETSRENLVRFKPGNKAAVRQGRPKKLPGLDELLSDVLARQTGGKSNLERILLGLIRKASQGDSRCAALLLDRKYGKLKDTVAVLDTFVVEIEEEEPSTIQWGNKTIVLRK